MRIRSVIALVALLAWGCAREHSPPAPDQSPRLDQRQDQLFAAMAAGDADAVADLFAEDAVLHVANMPPIRGRSAIRRFYGNVFGFLTASTADPETIRVSTDGDMAYGSGSVVNWFRGREGPVEYVGKYALVWRRVEGEWMIVLYSVSSNQPDASR